jgi:hypothetical protein
MADRGGWGCFHLKTCSYSGKTQIKGMSSFLISFFRTYLAYTCDTLTHRTHTHSLSLSPYNNTN